jgi:hypothetical protein
VTYATGATVYAAHHLTDVDHDRPITWTPWVEGIEQTAIITLDSPHGGPPLLSGFGDIGGFAHEDLNTSPAGMYADPRFDNTNTIDVAGRASVVVRSGVGHDKIGPTLGLSQDLGRTWRPVITPGPTGDAAITVSADGASLAVMTPTPIVSHDLGRTWTPVAGAPTSSRLVADRVDGKRFYALDFDTGSIFASTDAAASFADLHSRGLPGLAAERPHWREAPWPLYATPGRVGDLWVASKSGLFHSTDGGVSFERAGDYLSVQALSFGKPAPGRTTPTLFALGAHGDARAIWRSDDEGASWLRVNDTDHEYGRRFRSIAGDPRVFGRVYVGTDGRGVLYGEPAAPPPSAPRADARK